MTISYIMCATEKQSSTRNYPSHFRLPARKRAEMERNQIRRRKKKFERQPLPPPFFLFFFPFLLRLARPLRLLAMHRYPNKRASENTPSFFLLLPAYYSVQPIGRFSLKNFLSYRTVTDCVPTTGRTRINCPCARTLELPLLVRSSVFSFFFLFCLGG